MELLGQLYQPTNQPGTPPWRLTPHTPPPPPPTVNNMVISSISEGAINIDFALFLLVVTMGTCSTHHRKTPKPKL